MLSFIFNRWIFINPLLDICRSTYSLVVYECTPSFYLHILLKSTFFFYLEIIRPRLYLTQTYCIINYIVTYRWMMYLENKALVPTKRMFLWSGGVKYKYKNSEFTFSQRDGGPGTGIPILPPHELIRPILFFRWSAPMSLHMPIWDAIWFCCRSCKKGAQYCEAADSQ